MAFENKRIELECSVVVGAGVNYLMQIKLPNSEIAKTVSKTFLDMQIKYLTYFNLHRTNSMKSPVWKKKIMTTTRKKSER